MFKLILKNNYELYQYNYGTKVYELLCKLNYSDSFYKYIKLMNPNLSITQEELTKAIRSIEDSKCNVAEFGINGMFIMAYYIPTCLHYIEGEI